MLQDKTEENVQLCVYVDGECVVDLCGTSTGDFGHDRDKLQVHFLVKFLRIFQPFLVLDNIWCRISNRGHNFSFTLWQRSIQIWRPSVQILARIRLKRQRTHPDRWCTQTRIRIGLVHHINSKYQRCLEGQYQAKQNWQNHWRWTHTFPKISTFGQSKWISYNYEGFDHQWDCQTDWSKSKLKLIIFKIIARIF